MNFHIFPYISMYFHPRFQCRRGQMTMEFTFSMVMIMLMIFALVMVFRWSGMDIAERRLSHDEVLTDPGRDQLEQVDPNFHLPTEFGATFR